MKKSFISTMLLMILFGNAHAGFHSFTMHSRANCGNNETISWEAGVSRMLWTSSNHYRNGVLQHYVIANWENTWRSAAVHWGEAGPGSGWQVVGYHWIHTDRDYQIGYTNVTDCSIYDGWWD